MTELGLSIAQKLKDIRRAKKLEQKYVAAQIGITESKLGHYENGRAEPDIDTLYRLSKFYDVSLDDWLNLNDLNEQMVITQNDEKLLIKKYRELPDDTKEDICDYVSMKYNKHLQQKGILSPC